MSNKAKKIMTFILAASMTSSAFAQVSTTDLSDNCQGDIELTEYLAALLNGQPGMEDVVNQEHMEQIHEILNTHSELDMRGRFEKVMDACSKGTILQGRYN